MTVTKCAICGKDAKWSGWMETYPQLAVLKPVRNYKGEICHGACLKMHEKELFNRSQGLPVPEWIPEDIRTLSSSELGKVKRGRYKKYYENQESK